METTQSFYADLDVVADFTRVVETELYRPFPLDWQIIIADVTDSTQAIKQGKYKEVNLIGASCIVAALNACKGLSIPFAFGGDGAALVVPPTVFRAVSQAIHATQKLSRDQFGLILRAGAVPVSRINEMGFDLYVAKVRMSENFNQAMFHGNGLVCAEKLIKDPLQSKQFELQAEVDASADYTGLECRWRDISSAAGETHCLLVKAVAASDLENQETYHWVLDKIHEVYGVEDEYHPIPIGNLDLSLSPRAVTGEARLQGTSPLQILSLNLLGKLLFAKKTKTFGVDWQKYKAEVRENCDYRKFDGMLRMVIGGNRAQRECLDSYLKSKAQDGKLVYGLHHSNHASMTCLVFSREGNHLHFVDGGDGGYALAAQQMKGQEANQFR